MKKLPYSIDRIFFMFSPLLSIPLVVRGGAHGDRVSLILLCCCVALVSYGFIPVEAYDKAYYVGLYDQFQGMSLSAFYLDFLSTKPDFLFYVILYFWSVSGFPFELFSFLVTFLTCYFIFSVFFGEVRKSSFQGPPFLLSVLLVFALSLP